MADDRYNIRRPQPGRPSDRRVDEAYLRVRPELNGLEPFDEAEDIDVIDEVQRVVNNVRADVAYADPALGAALDTALNDTLPAKVAEVDAAVDAIPGQVSAGLAPVAPALADIAQSQTSLAMLRNMLPVSSVDAIGSTAGYYIITGGVEAGAVYERLNAGGLIPQPGLAPMARSNAVQRAADRWSLGRASPQTPGALVGRDFYEWKQGSTEQHDGGAIIAPADGVGRWVTDWRGDARTYGYVGDGALHTLSERYTTRADAIRDYPHAAALEAYWQATGTTRGQVRGSADATPATWADVSLDWAALQAALIRGERTRDGLQQARGGVTVRVPKGAGVLNAHLYMNLDRMYIEGEGAMITSLCKVLSLNLPSQNAGGWQDYYNWATQIGSSWAGWTGDGTPRHGGFYGLLTNKKGFMLGWAIRRLSVYGFVDYADRVAAQMGSAENHGIVLYDAQQVEGLDGVWVSGWGGHCGLFLKGTSPFNALFAITNCEFVNSGLSNIRSDNRLYLNNTHCERSLYGDNVETASVLAIQVHTEHARYGFNLTSASAKSVLTNCDGYAVNSTSNNGGSPVAWIKYNSDGGGVSLVACKSTGWGVLITDGAHSLSEASFGNSQYVTADFGHWTLFQRVYIGAVQQIPYTETANSYTGAPLNVWVDPARSDYAMKFATQTNYMVVQMQDSNPSLGSGSPALVFNMYASGTPVNFAVIPNSNKIFMVRGSGVRITGMPLEIGNGTNSSNNYTNFIRLNGSAITTDSTGNLRLITAGIPTADTSGRIIPQVQRVTTTLDFPSIPPGGQAELTVTVTSAAVGDSVSLARPAGSEAGLVSTARVTAANTVTVRVSNITAAAIDPAAASYGVTVYK